jgi:hypothetical protein
MLRPRKVQSDKIKQHKKRVNYTINKHTIDRFKVVADKDMRKMSNIVENLIRRYVESRVFNIIGKIFGTIICKMTIIFINFIFIFY